MARRPPGRGAGARSTAGQKIVARAPGIEIEATRPKFEGEFTSIVVRFGPGCAVAEGDGHEVASHAPVSLRGRRARRAWNSAAPRRRGHRPSRSRSTGPATSSRPISEVPEVWRVARQGLSPRPDQPGDHLPGDDHVQGQRRPPLSRLRRPSSGSTASSSHYKDAADPLSSEQILALIQEIAPCGTCASSTNICSAATSTTRSASDMPASPRSSRPAPPLHHALPAGEDPHVRGPVPPPESVEKLAKLHFGMILVTGMTVVAS